MATSAAWIDLDEAAAPATPATGKVRIYAKTDGSAYQKDDAGTETGLATASATAREEFVANWTVASTKTNIGTSYVDVYTDTNIQGNAIRIDFTGKTQYRVDVIWNKVGAGTQALKVCNQADDTEILHEFTNLASGGNGSGLQTIPAAFSGEAGNNFKLMAKSSTGTDDPVFLGCRVFLK